ncbi:TPA: TetR/AcrR family transcriptional regulator [Pseudomonas aeruginosa]|uniref:TetR/AcrR family transcriptional regulator n=1 Tax=Pseudomonas aeruginosa TaxID=287 RepID=UPI000935EBBC|nr:TetR/AcrR family transcriptional regulator [Pseudomonas aeruginosa]EIU2707421.1 TetR/AcrR family transcriptional regulator [Pseudomonas aeruginosa]EIU3714097.1 TetR/AcrR family transcriptional regulator [Pseudomonas aeruginosa]EIU3907017.1 TetR/AcrR family transcriptional regulator [Pseudomonas aeruginosa]EKV3217009.1 TetR/AcrR family transcriptional regulator [Pseudomonas aeruginosa]EKX1101081.1 TetR/AcrR family transcriptional regulator [Pseudomonas aeruginosa]
MARIGAEERRQDFIEATIKVIAEHGIANATTRRIAAAADSPLASLHYVFHTKEDLFYAVYESLINLPQRSLQAPANALPAESVGEMLRQLVKWFIAHPERAITQFELFFWSLRNDPEMAAKIYTVSIEATQQAIQKATGDALDQAALTTVSRLLINLFDGLLLSWTAHGNLERLEAETETACQAVKLLVASY